MKMLTVFLFSLVLLKSCSYSSKYKQYQEYNVGESYIDSTLFLNSLKVRAFFYNYNVCESEFSSILIFKRKKFNEEWKNHIEQ